MRHLVSQFRRIWHDTGQNDKIFAYQEYKLNEALARLHDATNEVVKWSTRLQDLLTLKEKPSSSDPSIH